MTMVLTTDVYFGSEPKPNALIAATARAFDVPANTVVVAPLISDDAYNALHNPAVTVLWRREPDDQPGSFPARFQLAIPEEAEASVFQRLSVVAEHLGIPFVTEADRDYQLRLYLTNGVTRVIPDDTTYDDDYAIVLRPSDQAALDRAIASTSHAIAS